MKKIASFFDRINKKILAGALSIAAAVLLFLSPGSLLYTVIKIVGAVIVIAAAIRFICLAGRGGALPFTSVLHVTLLFALGMILLCTPGSALRFIFSAIGVYLVITALLQAAKLFITPKPARGALWWADAIFTAVVALLGLWLLLSPRGAGRVTEIIAGVSLAVKGAELLLDAMRGDKPKSKRRKKAENGDIEADFVDKSDEL